MSRWRSTVIPTGSRRSTLQGTTLPTRRPHLCMRTLRGCRRNLCRHGAGEVLIECIGAFVETARFQGGPVTFDGVGGCSIYGRRLSPFSRRPRGRFKRGGERSPEGACLRRSGGACCRTPSNSLLFRFKKYRREGSQVVNGDRLKIDSRRSSRVRIPPLAFLRHGLKYQMMTHIWGHVRFQACQI